MPRIVDHDQKKIEIVQQAIKVFARRGYNQTKLAEIAAGCNMGRTNIYRYFSNKKEIFNYVIDKIFTDLRGELEKIADKPGEKGLERIKRIIERLAREFHSQRNLMIIMVELRILLQRGETDLGDLVREYVEDLRGVFACLLEEGMEKGEIKQINAEKMARTLVLMVESLVLHLAFTRNFTIDDHLQNLFFFIDGLQE